MPEVEPVARAAAEVRRLRAELLVLAGLEDEGDPEIKTMAREEIEAIHRTLPAAPNARSRSRCCRATPRRACRDARNPRRRRRRRGGVFAADLFRMYQRYAKGRGGRSS